MLTKHTAALTMMRSVGDLIGQASIVTSLAKFRVDEGEVDEARTLSLTVEPGARHALIGPNGAGKGTTFKLVTGLLRADAGRVELAGRDVTWYSEVRRCRLGMSQTPQHASLFGTMTAAENVALAVQRHAGGRIVPVPRGSEQCTSGRSRCSSRSDWQAGVRCR